MTKKVITIESIGKIQLVKSSKAKYIRIVIKPFEGVKVSVPRSISFSKAEKLVFQKISWIQKNLKKVDHIENNVTIFDEKGYFKTRNHVLHIFSYQGEKVKGKIAHNRIIIYYPKERDVRQQEIQVYIRKYIEKALRKEAKEYIPLRVAYFAKKYGFNYNHSLVLKTFGKGIRIVTYISLKY